MINKSQYPKTFELLGQFLQQQMTKKLPPNTPQLTDILPGETLANLAISTNGRILYEFFDSYNLYPGVYKVPMGWKWCIEGTVPMMGNAGTREEGESKAFEECAKRLENF